MEGNAAIDKTDSVSARKLGLQALEIFEREKAVAGIARANHLLGLAANLQGDRAEARKRFAAAIEGYESLGDLRGRAGASRGLIAVAGMPIDEVKALVDRGVADARALGDKQLEGSLLHTLADKLYGAGEYGDSLQALERAAGVLDGPDPESRDALGTVYNSMGRLYRTHGQVDTALAYQLKALAIHEVTGTPFTHLQSLNAVAVTYENLGDLRNARTYYRQALALAEQSSSPRIQDFIRGNLAEIMRESAEDYEGVAKTLEGILERGFDNYPSRRWRALSSVYLRLGRPADALAAAEKAFAACGARESLACVDALNQRSEANAALGNGRAALDDVRTALETIEGVRTRLVPSDFFKQQFSVAQTATYSRAIALQLREDRVGEALETAELARARAFVDLLASKELQPRQSSERASVPLVLRGPNFQARLPHPPRKSTISCRSRAVSSRRCSCTGSPPTMCLSGWWARTDA